MQELEKSGEWYDRALWSELAKVNLTALALPESVGGGGCGIVETCLVLEEQGRHLAPVPLLPTLLLGGIPIADFGTADQREHWLRPVAEGEAVLTAGLHEEGGALPALPGTRARRDDSGWRLDGAKVCVPAAHLADAILVPARTSDTECHVFIVEPSAEGASYQTSFKLSLPDYKKNSNSVGCGLRLVKTNYCDLLQCFFFSRENQKWPLSHFFQFF